MPYHHGDLRRALLDAAAAEIAASGVAGVSLRKLAASVGVSHAAATHHFGDKAGVLTALAAEGHALLRDATAQAPGLLEAGVAYLRFAAEHPGHFAVMFEPSAVHRHDPALVDASEGSFEALEAHAGSTNAAIAAWAFVHGLATLHLAGALGTTSTRQLVAKFKRAAATLGRPGLS